MANTTSAATAASDRDASSPRPAHSESGNSSSSDSASVSSDDVSEASADDAGSDARSGSEHGDAQSIKSNSRSGANSPEPPPPPQRGLVVEDRINHTLPVGDLVIVHGLNKTPWATERVPDTGCRSSTAWLFQDAGYSGWQYLSYFFDVADNDENQEPPIYYHFGIELEAQKLLDGIVQYRRALAEREDFASDQFRRINFIAHDVGGTIVKKALSIASHDPERYGDLLYSTTGLIFLGTPHRITSLGLEDTLAKLLYLPETVYVKNLHERVRPLARAIQYANGEFYETNALMQSFVINIYNQGQYPLAGPAPVPSSNASAVSVMQPPGSRVQSPWEVETAIFDTPLEFCNRTDIPHLRLSSGGHPDPNMPENNIALRLRNNKDEFPQSMIILPPWIVARIGGSDSWFHKLFLTLAPPCAAAQTTQFCWQPYFIEEWMVTLDTYKSWLNDPGVNVLYAHLSSEVAVTSQVMFAHLQGMELVSNMLYFEFKRHDCRYNTLEAMLISFIGHLITRTPPQTGSSTAVPQMLPLLESHSTLNLYDLLSLFRTMLLWRRIPPMVFMVANVGECSGGGKHKLAELISDIRHATEIRHAFLITGLPDADFTQRLGEPSIINLDDFDRASAPPVWTETFDKRYGFRLNMLSDVRPVFMEYLPQVRDILERCDTDYRLAHVILWWLTQQSREGRDTRARARLTLQSLEPATPDAVLQTIVQSFGQDQTMAWAYVNWLTVAFRPLSMKELGIAVAFTEDPTEETLTFIDYNAFRTVINQFNGVSILSDHAVQLWLPYYAEGKHFDQEALEKTHAQVAELCLAYLSMESVQNLATEYCDRFTSLNTAPVSPPKDTLFAYAAQYWPQHYRMGGDLKPLKQVLDFFHDSRARNVWWRVCNTLSNPVTRSRHSYLSPLPLIAAIGLEDVLVKAIELESDSEYLATDAGLALLEAVREGHCKLVPFLTQYVEASPEQWHCVVLQAAKHNRAADLDQILDIMPMPLSEKGTLKDLLERTVWCGWADQTSALLNRTKSAGLTVADLPQRLLHLAVASQSEEVVDALLDFGVEIDLPDESGRTALQVAASAGCADTTQLLLARGADIEKTYVPPIGDWPLSPLQLAVGSGDFLSVEVLLKAGANPNYGTETLSDLDGEFHETWPLVTAAVSGFGKCVQLLIEYKADLSATANGKSALWYAIDRGRTQSIKPLLAAGANVDEVPMNSDTLLIKAVMEDDMTLFDLLLDHGASVDLPGGSDALENTPLSCAIVQNSVEMVTKLLEKGADVNYRPTEKSHPPIYAAARLSRVEMVDMLLDRKVDLNQRLMKDEGAYEREWTALHAAHGDVSMVTKLLDHGAEIDATSSDGTCLWLASCNNHLEVVELLLSKGAAVDTPRSATAHWKDELNLIESTPLSAACAMGHVDVVRALLRSGADPNYAIEDIETGTIKTCPLKLCFAGGNPAQLLEVLLAHKVDVTGKFTGERTILHYVTEYTPCDAVRMLHDAGASVLEPDANGLTPFLAALQCSNDRVAQYFISKGADVNTFHRELGTPLHMVCRNNDDRTDLFKALIAAGASVARADQQDFKETCLAAVVCNGVWVNQEPILKHLVEVEGVDMNAKSNMRPHYALSRAAREPGYLLVKYLIEHGANVNIEDSWGLRPIHYAAWFSWDMYKLLIDSQAEPMPMNRIAMTPIHYAAAGRVWNDEFDEIMEKSGAKITDADADGWTPVLWSAKWNYTDPDVLEALIKRSGDDAIWVRGKATGDSEWSPLKASRYYGSTEAIYQLLTPAEDRKTRVKPSGDGQEQWDDDFHVIREADAKGGFCDICLCSLYGFRYHCKQCLADLCYKCVRSKDLFDSGHEYEQIGPEFPEPSEAGDGDDDARGDITPFHDRESSSSSISEDESEGTGEHASRSSGISQGRQAEKGSESGSN